MSKTKVVLDARMIDASGIGVYVKALIEPMSANFELILLGDPEKLKDYGAITSIIPFFSPVYSIKEQMELPKLVPECDIFWSPHYNVPLMPVKARKRIVTIHDVFHLAFYDTLNFKQKLYAKFVIKKAVNASDAIVTVSDFSKSELLKYTPAKAQKIAVIHNGVKQIATRQNIKTVREKYNLPARYLLFVGNVKPHKNLKSLLTAYLKLPADIRSNYKVVVVGKKDGFITGDKALIDWIDHTPELSDSVLFTGFVADEYLDTIYAAASAFIFPSLYEGFGLPPLEAMLNRCPVISSNASSLPEVCGNAAVYFDPLNTVEIAQKLQEVLTNKILTQALVAKGLERIKLFNWQNTAEEHIKLFKRISIN